MFASMFKSLFDKTKKNLKTKNHEAEWENVTFTARNVEEMLTELKELPDADDDVIEAIELSVTDSQSESSSDSDSCSEEEYVHEIKATEEHPTVAVESGSSVEDPSRKKLVNQIGSLQCLFTWNLNPQHSTNYVFKIKNKYGDYNLDISTQEFTLERYIGNLIISYELFHNNESELAQMKVLEIGKWLEELDNGTDEFYLSISTGLKHVVTSTFIHMLYAGNLIVECKWLLNDIVSFANMDSKPRAAVHSVRAAILTEYGDELTYLKKSCECAKKACDLDPKTAHWFYIYSLSLTALRHFLHSYRSGPVENEVNTIQQAVMLSEEKNPLFIFHKTVLYKDTVMNDFHTSSNKNDTNLIEKNLQENKTIVQMIKYIISLEPKDPHLIVKCAKMLITLPFMVRDFKLGKQYLNKAVQMAPNDITVLNAVTETVELYKKMPLKNKSTLDNELKCIVKKHKNGEDPIPYLIDLVLKYHGHDRCKILAQICSYTILFTNNLKYGIEQFIMLMQQSEIEYAKYNLVLQHVSIFGSKEFNLAELICNEIRLTTNSRGNSEDMLFYYQMLAKIIEMCNLEIKSLDSSMKINLIIDLSTKCNLVSKQNHNTASKKKLQKKCSLINTFKCNNSSKKTSQNKNAPTKSAHTNKTSSVNAPKTDSSSKKPSQNTSKCNNSSKKTSQVKNAPTNKTSSVKAPKTDSSSKKPSQNTSNCNNSSKKTSQNKNAPTKSAHTNKTSSVNAPKTNSSSKKQSQNSTATKSTPINKSLSVNAPKINSSSNKTSKINATIKNTPVNKISSVNDPKINSCSKKTSQINSATKSTTVNKSSSVNVPKINSSTNKTSLS